MDDIKDLRKIEEAYSSFPDFNYDYSPWLEQAEKDLSVAKVLLDNKDYSSFIYHLQQSVEKSVKYIFISLGLYREDKVAEKISHSPEKAFRRGIELYFKEQLSSFDKEIEKAKKKL